MLHFVMGRGGSPRVKTLYEAVGKTEGKCLLIAPEQFSLTHETGLLESVGEGASLKIEVLSFRRLPDFVFRHLGGGQRTYIAEGGTRIVLAKALAELQGSLTYFKNLSQKTDFLDMLLASLREFTSYRMTGDKLWELSKMLESENGTFSNKCADLALIYETYLTLLDKEWSGAEFAIDHACARLQEENIFSSYTVFISDFKGFTPQEYRMLDYLLQAKDVYVNLLTDGFIEQEDGVFSFSNQMAQKLLELAEERGISVEKALLSVEEGLFAEAIAHLEAQLFLPAPTLYLGVPKGVELVRCPQPYEEAEWIAAKIQRLVQEEGVRFRDIAVVTRQAISSPQISAIFTKRQIAHQMDAGDFVLKYPLFHLVFSAFEVLQSGFSLNAMLAYLKSGLCGVSEAEGDRMETYAVPWNIRGDSWKKPFFKNPNGFNRELTAAGEATLAELNAVRERMVGPLLAFERHGRQKNTRQISTGLYELLVALRVPEQLQEACQGFREAGDEESALKYARLWTLLMEGMDQMVLLAEEEMSLERYSELLRQSFGETVADIIPATLDQVLVTGADKVRPASFSYVFLMDFTEGSFPKNLGSGTIITDSEKVLLRDFGVKLSAPAYEASFEERYYAYVALTAAKKGVFLTYSEAEVSGAPKRPSHYLLFLKALFPELSETVYRPITRYVAETVETGKKHLRFADPAVASRLYRQSRALSPSAIEKYRKCKFLFFCENGLGLQAYEEWRFDARETGTFLHYVLEALFQAIPTVEKSGLRVKDVSALEEAAFATLIDDSIASYIRRFFPRFAEEEPRFRHQFLRLRRIVDSFTEQLLAELQNSEFLPLDFELEIGKDVEAYAVGGETGVVVRGKIDRVDGFLKDGILYLRIVDYKTGRKKLDVAELQEGLSLQMFLYLFALLKSGEKRYGKPVAAAGVVYAPVRLDVLQGIQRGAAEEEFEKAQKKLTGKNGLLLAEEDVVLAMDKSGKFSQLPVKVTEENGKRSLDLRYSSLANREDFQNLQLFAERIVGETRAAVLQGEIGADPLLDGDRYSPCDVCRLQEVCNHREDAKPLQPIQAADFWQKLAKEAAKKEGE